MAMGRMGAENYFQRWQQYAKSFKPAEKSEAGSGGEPASAVPVRGRGGWGRDQDRDLYFFERSFIPLFYA
jgi:hypothetical protein